MNIVGFEGGWEAPALVACATAAVEDGTFILNPLTKRRVPIEEAKILAQDGHLHLFAKAITVAATEAGAPLTVVAIRRVLAEAAPFLVDTGRTGGLVGQARTKEEQFYVFSSQVALDEYREEVCNRVLETALADTRPNGLDLPVLARWAAALHPQNPFAQSLRVYFATNKTYVRKVARAMVAETRREAFDQLTDALTTPDLDYVLKYERGAASGGGFDIDVAVRALRSMGDLHNVVKPLLQERYPFLGSDVPAPRFKTLVAASAEFHFATHIEGRPLRERVARHIEIDLFRQVLGGRRPPDLERSEKLERAVAQIANPTPDTILSQVVGEEREIVEAPPPPPTIDPPVTSPTFTVLAYMAGVAKDSQRAELKIFPGFTVLTPISEGIPGQETLGVEFISRQNVFLRRPIVATLRKNIHRGRPESFSLVALSPLVEGRPQRIDAYPSSVFADAIVAGHDIELTRTDATTIASKLGSLRGVDATGKEECAAWMRTYADLCAAYELADQAIARPLILLLPQRSRQVSALGRVLAALHMLGGTSTVSALVVAINEQHDATVRINNTRREVYRHPKLLEFDEANEQIMKLTPLGRVFALAYATARRDEVE